MARQNGEEKAGKDAHISSLTAGSRRSGVGSSSMSGARTGDAHLEAERRKEPSVIELPADRTSKIEMGEHSAVHEMHARNDWNEMGADIPAWELDSQGKS